MKKKFNEYHHSTNVVQSKHAISVRKAVLVESKSTGSEETVWIEMDDNAQITHLRQVLLPSSTPEQKKFKGKLHKKRPITINLKLLMMAKLVLSISMPDKSMKYNKKKNHRSPNGLVDIFKVQ